MIKASIDIPKLQKSLKVAAKAFGDSTEQAVVRWSIQTCRELAVTTQVFGRGKKERDKQAKAIEMGGYAVINIVEPSKKPRNGNRRLLRSISAINDWIDQNRGAKGRTRKLPPEQRKDATRELFDKAMRQRKKLAGMAKGGWIGAGQAIAKRQKGQDRINIGRNYVGYAHRHSGKGAARLAGGLFRPFTLLTNNARHTSSSHVVKKGAHQQAAARALRPTITSYRKSLRNKLGK
jgi:hypothetical protein